MKTRFVFILLALFTTKLAFADVSLADEKLTSRVGADASSQITFEPGRATLSSQEIMALRDLVAEARMNNEQIDEVKVIVWGDNVYSETAGSAASKQDKKLAAQRIKNIKAYITKDLGVRDVETFNMSRDPQRFSDLIRAAGSTVRNLAPRSDTEGATAFTSQNISSFQKGNPSEALILVYKK